MRLWLFLFCVSSLFATDETTLKYINYLQHLPAKTKKHRFYKLVLPPTQKVHTSLLETFLQVKKEVAKKTISPQTKKLLKTYKAKDYKELLVRLKPHPVSITLAQAAIESGWGTSRFFVEANNIFGMWSKTQKDAIRAEKTRSNGKVIHVKKYKTLLDAIKAYYYNIATNKAYEKFRKARYESKDPYEIVAFLDNYSEKKELYTAHLIKVMYYNNMTKYDSPLFAVGRERVISPQ